MLPVRLLSLFSITAFAVMVSGCAPKSEPTAEGEQGTASAPAGAPKDSTAAAPGRVEIGMDVAKVQEIKGPPDQQMHEHGPKGEEYDVWVWKDQRATFESGKVVKVEPAK